MRGTRQLRRRITGISGRQTAAPPGSRADRPPTKVAARPSCKGSGPLRSKGRRSLMMPTRPLVAPALAALFGLAVAGPVLDRSAVTIPAQAAQATAAAAGTTTLDD